DQDLSLIAGNIAIADVIRLGEDKTRRGERDRNRVAAGRKLAAELRATPCHLRVIEEVEKPADTDVVRALHGRRKVDVGVQAACIVIERQLDTRRVENAEHSVQEPS